MRSASVAACLLLLSSTLLAQTGAYQQLQTAGTAPEETFDGRMARGSPAFQAGPSLNETASNDYGTTLRNDFGFTDDQPPPQPERDRREKDKSKAGWIGAGIGAGVGILLFGGLALGGVLPWTIMLAGVPAFAVLGASAGMDAAE